jgi:hypothetical protein
MEASNSSPSLPNPRLLGTSHPWFGLFIAVIDDRLRLRDGVYEYTHHQDCIFRIQTIASAEELLLCDGTHLQAGAKLINLHLWNEQIPPMPKGGPTFGWARRMDHAVDISLRELARHLRTRPDLADVAAVCANLTLAPAEREHQVVHIMQRYGFERVSVSDRLSLGERMHRLGENIFISMLVFAHNSAALHADSLRRDRVLMCLSRRILQHRYGFAPEDAG